MTFRALVLAAAAALLAVPSAARAQELFAPGDRTLYQEGFAHAGSALRRLRNVGPRIGVATHDGRPFLHARTPSSFEIPLSAVLPERFTLEYEFHIPGVNQSTVTVLGSDGEEKGSVACGPHTLNFSDGRGDDRVVELDGKEGFGDRREEAVNYCAVAVDGDRVRVWINSVLAADETGLSLGRGSRLRVSFAGVDDPTLLDQNIPVWLTEFRVAGVTP